MTTTQFQKTNRPSFIKYGHLCLPKRIYKALHRAFGKAKTRGTCTFGGSRFNCYVDWVESKLVWMLRVADAREVLSAIGPNARLVLQMNTGNDTFELTIAIEEVAR